MSTESSIATLERIIREEEILLADVIKRRDLLISSASNIQESLDRNKKKREELLNETCKE